MVQGHRLVRAQQQDREQFALAVPEIEHLTVRADLDPPENPKPHHAPTLCPFRPVGQ
ncbi:hypothetical protein GCM10009733_082610 [Nonomuraea maheshkhaliensis]|uniref:Uncharacterized protein n=1 Tax=Nonomuraea maheshkhaliensis TaxID=419590 RepID=A0ABN2GMA6_9ACTN